MKYTAKQQYIWQQQPEIERKLAAEIDSDTPKRGWQIGAVKYNITHSLLYIANIILLKFKT